MNKPEKDEPLAIEVGIEEPVISESEMQELLKRQGFADVSLARMKDVQNMGIYVGGLGVLKMQRGRAMINQQRVDDAMRQMSELLAAIMAGTSKQKIAQATKVVQTIAYVSRALTDAQKFLAEVEERANPGRQPYVPKLPEVMNQGFTPGQDVQPGMTLTMREVTLRPDHIPVHAITDKAEK